MLGDDELKFEKTSGDELRMMLLTKGHPVDEEKITERTSKS